MEGGSRSPGAGALRSTDSQSELLQLEADVARLCAEHSPPRECYRQAAFWASRDGGARLVVARELAAVRPANAEVIKDAIRLAILEGYGVVSHEIVLMTVGQLPAHLEGAAFRAACREAHILGTLGSAAPTVLDQVGVASIGEPDWLSNAVREVAVSPHVSTESGAEPRNKTESELVLLWSSMLGVEKVGIHDNFLDLGGHSLLAIRCAWRIMQIFGVEVPVRHFFGETNAIADIARVIDELCRARSCEA